MKFPEIPTDNLYKFMALSGITIILASLLPCYLSYQIQIEAIRLSGKLEELKAVSDYSELRHKTLAATIDGLLKVRARAEELKEQQNTEKILEELHAKQAENTEMLWKSTLAAIQHKAQWKELLYLKRWYNLTRIISALAFVCGLILTIRGFQLWKEKLQIPQDLIIKQKAEEATKTPRMAKDTKGEI